MGRKANYELARRTGKRSSRVAGAYGSEDAERNNVEIAVDHEDSWEILSPVSPKPCRLRSSSSTSLADSGAVASEERKFGRQSLRHRTARGRMNAARRENGR